MSEKKKERSGFVKLLGPCKYIHLRIGIKYIVHRQARWLYPRPSVSGAPNGRGCGGAAARAAPAARTTARASTWRWRRRQGGRPGCAGPSGHRTPHTRRALDGAAPQPLSAPSAPPPLVGTACATAAAQAVELHAAGASTCAVQGMESLPKRVHMRLPHGVRHSGCAKRYGAPEESPM